MIKGLSHEDYIQWKAGEWGVSVEEARRRIEEGNRIVEQALSELPEGELEDQGPSWPFLTTEELNKDIKEDK